MSTTDCETACLDGSPEVGVKQACGGEGGEEGAESGVDLRDSGAGLAEGPGSSSEIRYGAHNSGAESEAWASRQPSRMRTMVEPGTGVGRKRAQQERSDRQADG